MKASISVINSGSSSIKFSLFAIPKTGPLKRVFYGQVEGIGVDPCFRAKDDNGSLMEERRWAAAPHIDHEYLMGHIVEWIKANRIARNLELLGVGHRVVHGGDAYQTPVMVDADVITRLESFTPLAPLHQPHNLMPIRTVARMYPELPQVACFDTSFHHTNSPIVRNFALPRRLVEAGVRRYGFHGLSYEFIAQQLATVDPKAASGRTVVAHLGSGASMCALKNGKSIASTMGFSAIDGLPMATRTGNLDPGVLLYLMQTEKMDASDIETLLYRESGLLGLSGISRDMRVLLESESDHAEEAVSVFVSRAQRELGGLVAVLGGLDAVVFTAGIGENSSEIRARILHGTQWLGIDCDPAANASGAQKISSENSRVNVWVIPTNEELMIANHTRLHLQRKGIASCAKKTP